MYDDRSPCRVVAVRYLPQGDGRGDMSGPYGGCLTTVKVKHHVDSISLSRNRITTKYTKVVICLFPVVVSRRFRNCPVYIVSPDAL